MTNFKFSVNLIGTFLIFAEVLMSSYGIVVITCYLFQIALNDSSSKLGGKLNLKLVRASVQSEVNVGLDKYQFPLLPACHFIEFKLDHSKSCIYKLRSTKQRRKATTNAFAKPKK